MLMSAIIWTRIFFSIFHQHEYFMSNILENVVILDGNWNNYSYANGNKKFFIYLEHGEGLSAESRFTTFPFTTKCLQNWLIILIFQVKSIVKTRIDCEFCK